MDDDNLGSKKMNNKQLVSDKLLETNGQHPNSSAMHSEIEINTAGVKKVVERARNTNHDEKNKEPITNKNISTKPSTASETIGKLMIENRDKNFDITEFRYPNSSPENQKNPKEEN